MAENSSTEIDDVVTTESEVTTEEKEVPSGKPEPEQEAPMPEEESPPGKEESPKLQRESPMPENIEVANQEDVGVAEASFIDIDDVDISVEYTVQLDAALANLLFGTATTGVVNVGAYVRMMGQVQDDSVMTPEQLMSAAKFTDLGLTSVVSNYAVRDPDQYAKRLQAVQQAQVPFKDKERNAVHLASTFDATVNGKMFSTEAICAEDAFFEDMVVRYLPQDKLAIDSVVVGNVRDGRTFDVMDYQNSVAALAKGANVRLSFNTLVFDKDGSQLTDCDAIVKASGKTIVAELKTPIKDVVSGTTKSEINLLPYEGAVVHPFPRKAELKGATISAPDASSLVDYVAPTPAEVLAMVPLGSSGNKVDLTASAKAKLPAFKADHSLSALFSAHSLKAIANVATTNSPVAKRAIASDEKIDVRKLRKAHVETKFQEPDKPSKPPALPAPVADNPQLVVANITDRDFPEKNVVVNYGRGYLSLDEGLPFDVKLGRAISQEELASLKSTRALIAANELYENMGISEFNKKRDALLAALSEPEKVQPVAPRQIFYYSTEYKRITKYSGDIPDVDDQFVQDQDEPIGGYVVASDEQTTTGVEEQVSQFAAVVFGDSYADLDRAIEVISSATRFFVERHIRARTSNVTAKRKEINYQRPENFWLPQSLYDGLLVLHGNREPRVMGELQTLTTYFIGAVTIEVVRLKMFQIVETHASKGMSVEAQKRRVKDAFSTFAPDFKSDQLARCIDTVRGFERLLRSIAAGDATHLNSKNDSTYTLARWPAFRPSQFMRVVGETGDSAVAYLLMLNEQLADKTPRRLGKAGLAAASNQVISDQPVQDFRYHSTGVELEDVATVNKHDTTFRAHQGEPTAATWDPPQPISQIDTLEVPAEEGDADEGDMLGRFLRANKDALGGNFKDAKDVEKRGVEPLFEHAPEIKNLLIVLSPAKQRHVMTLFIDSAMRDGNASKMESAELLELVMTDDAVPVLLCLTLRIFERQREREEALMLTLLSIITSVNTDSKSMEDMLEHLREDFNQRKFRALVALDKDDQYLYRDMLQAKLGDWEPKDVGDESNEAIPVQRDDQED